MKNARNSQETTDGASKILKLAAWSVLASAAMCGMAWGDSDGATAAADPADATEPRATTAPATQPAAPAQPSIPVPQPVVNPSPRPATSQPADTGMVVTGLAPNGAVNMLVNKSAILTTRVPYKRVSIAQPDVAEINLVGPSVILLTAKKPGSTQLILWDDSDHSQVIDVLVSFDLHGLDTQLKQMFPKASIIADSANGTIILRGHVPDIQTAQQATAVAVPYNTGKDVLNFMEVSGGQQVVLQVRFAEVTRAVTTNLGFNAFATDGKFAVGGGTGPAGAAPVEANHIANSATPFPLYGGAVAGNTSFEYFITALRQNSLLRILAEPNLVASSGQEASFLAGGEIPILVPQASGGGSVTTVEYKKYGIQLDFTPTVLGNGRVRLVCVPQVSELDYAHQVILGGAPVPALTNRNVSTTVELAEGQTLALAGLLRNETNASKNITPVLGDLPILGELFRSVNYNRQETELVVLVTPHLVEGLNPNQMPRVTGEFWRHPTEAALLLQQDLGGPGPDLRHAPAVRSSRFYGAAGFNAASTPTDK